MNADLGAIVGRQVEVWMPTDRDRFLFTADVLGDDRGIYSVGGNRYCEKQVSLGEPVAPEVSTMNDASDLLSAGNVLDGNVVGLCLKDEAVHGVTFGCRKLADVIGRERDGVALPFSGQ